MNKMKEYAAMRKAQLKEQIAQMEYPPSLLILQVGEVEASSRYIRNKIKDCEEVGISTVHYKADENITTEELIDFINERQGYLLVLSSNSRFPHILTRAALMPQLTLQEM